MKNLLKEKKYITLSKPEKKINELWPFIKKQIEMEIKFFGYVPLIEESKLFRLLISKKKI